MLTAFKLCLLQKTSHFNFENCHYESQKTSSLTQVYNLAVNLLSSNKKTHKTHFNVQTAWI